MSVTFESLPDDESERHEALVAAFGELAVWFRNSALQRARRMVESPERRLELGRIHQEPYTAVSELDGRGREAAFALAETVVDHFAYSLLARISSQERDPCLGNSYAAWFRLDMEIIDLDTDEVVFEETVNREGRRFFPEYWSRWLNRFGRR